jgi:hypothetical protein
MSGSRVAGGLERRFEGGWAQQGATKTTGRLGQAKETFPSFRYKMMSSFLIASDPKFIFSIFDGCLGFHPSHLSFIVCELVFESSALSSIRQSRGKKRPNGENFQPHPHFEGVNKTQ